MTQIKKHQIADHNLTGASFISSLGLYDETANYAIGDIVIWKAKTYRCISAVTGSTEGDLSKTPDIATTYWTENKEDVLFSCYASTAQTFTNSRISIALNTTDISSTFASLSSNEITINKNITLLVGVSLNVDVDSGTTRSGSTAYLQLDSGSGYADVNNFEISMYHRTENNGRLSGSHIYPIKFQTGDKIRVQIIRYNGSNTLTTIANKCVVTLFNTQGSQGPKGSDGDITWHGAWQNQNYTENQAVEYNGSAYVCIQDTTTNQNPSNSTYWSLMASKGDTGATGPTGPSGDLDWKGAYSSSTTYNINDTVESDGSCYVCKTNNTLNDQPPSSNWDLVAQKGADGSGTSITIQEDGVNLSNTPHSTLNFTGDIVADDRGGGVARIRVPKPPFTVSYGMTGTQVVDSTIRVVPFDDVIKSHSKLSLNTSTGRITANDDLKLLIAYNIFMTLDSGDNARNTITAWLQVNGTKIDYSQTAAYTRGYNYNKYGNCSCPLTYVELDNGDYIEVAYVRDDDIQAPVIGSSQTWILIQQVPRTVT